MNAPLPPGQAETARFPVVGESAPAPGLAPADWRVTIGGRVDRPRDYDLAELRALGCEQRVSDLHCVTGWSRRAVTMRGVPLARVLAGCAVRDDARHVRFIAHSPRAHDTSLPLPLALAEAWLVFELDGEPLAAEHGGPLRVIAPSRYLYKSLKWLRAIELLDADRLGYWERESAYHNEADPLREQRFDERRTTAAETVAAFRAARDFAPWRGQVLLKARLGGWQPATPALGAVQLKSSSLRAARLAGCDLRGANLSLSNLEGADLRGADLRGADCEGASFAGADLRDARFEDCALSATRFHREFRNGRALAAQVEGAVFAGCSGLLETEAAFLVRHGAQGVPA